MSSNGGRFDWKTERDRIDLAQVATAYLGPAPGRRGERGRRLWWCCPFHEDPNPSFCVEPGKSWWKCHGCGERGDAASLVMRLDDVGFPEAVARLVDGHGPAGPARPVPKGPRQAPVPPDGPEGMPAVDALALVEAAESRLWSSEGANALAELVKRRRLAPETIRAARLGWSPRVDLTTNDGRCYTARGVVIPWFDGGRLALAKVRQPGNARPKYAEFFRDRPTFYPGPQVIRPGRAVVVVEGEYDALLLGQELSGLAGVATLGSASARVVTEVLCAFLPASPRYLATDADAAGDRAASAWPVPQSIRVRPPSPFKDWTEASQGRDGLGRVDLRRWWSERLAGVDPPALYTWDDLASWRWGPAVDAEADAHDDPASPLLLGRLYTHRVAGSLHLGIEVWCPHCKRPHVHSFDEPDGHSGKASHRVAHCVDGPFRDGGYYIGMDPAHSEHNRAMISLREAKTEQEAGEVSP